jgi:hypothetical protein
VGGKKCATATLDFSLGERQLAALREFAHRVAPLAGLPEVPTVELLGH